MVSRGAASQTVYRSKELPFRWRVGRSPIESRGEAGSCGLESWWQLSKILIGLIKRGDQPEGEWHEREKKLRNVRAQLKFVICSIVAQLPPSLISSQRENIRKTIFARGLKLWRPFRGRPSGETKVSLSHCCKAVFRGHHHLDVSKHDGETKTNFFSSFAAPRTLEFTDPTAVQKE